MYAEIWKTSQSLGWELEKMNYTWEGLRQERTWYEEINCNTVAAEKNKAVKSAGGPPLLGALLSYMS